MFTYKKENKAVISLWFLRLSIHAYWESSLLLSTDNPAFSLDYANVCVRWNIRHLFHYVGVEIVVKPY